MSNKKSSLKKAVAVTPPVNVAGDEPLGRLAYETHCLALWKSYHTGPLPQWPHVAAAVQVAWIVAAKAVSSATRLQLMDALSGVGERKISPSLPKTFGQLKQKK